MTQERIEAAAKVLATKDRTNLSSWHREEATDALAAADAVMFSDEGVERIKKALGDHMEGSLSCYDHIPSSGHYVWCCACGEHAITETWREHMARAVVAALKGDQ